MLPWATVMTFPGLPSLFLLGYLFILLPVAAARSARRLRSAEGTAPSERLPSREAIWTSTLITQGALLLLAWLVGRSFDFEIFAVHNLGVAEMSAAAATLVLIFGLRQVSRAIRTEEEKRSMVVFLLAPRTRREWVLWSSTGLVASIAEEAAYRGVAFSILWYSLGSPWVAALLCAVAFALAHAVQGWKSGVIIFVMALAMHALVVFTGTLVLAMIVHAVYDFVAAYFIGREARAYDAEEEGRAHG